MKDIFKTTMFVVLAFLAAQIGGELIGLAVSPEARYQEGLVQHELSLVPNANAGWNVVNYKEQGGARWVVGGSLDVVSGGDLDVESGGSLKIAGTQVTATATELNETFLSVSLSDVSTAATARTVTPHGGVVSAVYYVLNGDIQSQDNSILYPSVDGTYMTGSQILVASGATAGTTRNSTPSAGNTVSAGSVLGVRTDGASTGTAGAEVVFVITR